MSQAGIVNTSGSTPPPTVPTSFVTDSGTVIPAANVVNINGGFTSTNNNNGVQVIANLTGSNNEVVQLTNRFQATGSTVGATTANLVTFSLGAVPSTFFFSFSTVAFNASGPAGAGYETFTTVRTNGITATIIGDTDSIIHEDATLVATQAQIVLAGNSINYQVTGVAGLTIDWNAVGTYIQVS